MSAPDVVKIVHGKQEMNGSAKDCESQPLPEAGMIFV
jgi:hypothetical protein